MTGFDASLRDSSHHSGWARAPIVIVSSFVNVRGCVHTIVSVADYGNL